MRSLLQLDYFLEIFNTLRANAIAHGEPLTGRPFCRRLNFPNLTRRNRSLLPVPSWRTMTAFFVSCHQCILFSGCGYILARQRPGVREAPAVRKTGERCLAFFVFNPNLTRCLMSQSLPVLRGEVLTDRRFYRNLMFPKHTRLCRSLCLPQADKNRGVFCFCHLMPARAGSYWRNNVRVSVRPRRSRVTGERYFAFFVFQSQSHEVTYVQTS